MAEKVEKFKIDKNMQEFAKAYKKIKSVHNVVQQRIAAKMNALQNEQQRFGQLTKGLRFMLQNVPQPKDAPDGMNEGYGK